MRVLNRDELQHAKKAAAVKPSRINRTAPSPGDRGSVAEDHSATC
jgi:hypothetical protein